MIRMLASGQYRLYSRKQDPRTGRRPNLGTFPTLEAAQRHERAVPMTLTHRILDEHLVEGRLAPGAEIQLRGSPTSAPAYRASDEIHDARRAARVLDLTGIAGKTSSSARKRYGTGPSATTLAAWTRWPLTGDGPSRSPGA